MRVLAVDPSLRSTGFGLLEKSGNETHARAYGTIRNAANKRPSECLVAIHTRMVELIAQYDPQCLVVEAVIYVQSYRTAITLGSARGVILLAAAGIGLPIYEYAPRRVKQSVVGRGAADKSQVGFMVRALLGLTETPAADAADALAIGLTHFQMAGSAARGVGVMREI